MKKILYSLSAIAVIIMLVLEACSSGKASFERGDYYQAVITAVGHLRRNPGHKKSSETLRLAYPLAVQYYENQASNALSGNAEFKWTTVVNSYTSLNVMYDEISRAPGALAIIPNPNNYTSKLNEARQNAAGEQYNAGIAALGIGTRDKAKLAYGFFKRSLEFVANYKDANQKMQDALWAATVKVVVEPISGASRNYSLSTDFLNDKISEYVHANKVNEWVRFFSPAEAQQMRLNPDHIVKLAFDEFTVGNVFMSEKQIPLKRDSVVVATYVNNQVIQNTLIQNNTYNNSTYNNNTNNTVTNNNTTNHNITNNTNTSNTNTTNNTVTNNTTVVNPANTTTPTNPVNQPANNQTQGNTGNTGNQNTTTTNPNPNPQQQGNTSTGGNQGGGNQNDTNTNQNNSNPGTNNNQGNPTSGGNQNDSTQNNSNQGNTNTAGNQNNPGSNTANPNQGNPNTEPAKEVVIPENEQVTICHIPQGNPAARHTLVISRSALKAHLEHGDIEGSCEDPKNADKLKALDKKQPNEKKPDNKPADKGNDKKGNGGGNGFAFNNKQGVITASNSNEAALKHFFESHAAGDTNKVYQTVKATMYYYSKSVTTKGVLSLTILDAKTGAVLSAAKIPSEYIWTSEWATFNGDERALTPQQIQLSKQREQMPPPHQDLFRNFTGPIYDQVTQRLREYYRNF